MDERAEAELQRLRARAYGPGADIHDDPLALLRLNELEEVHRAGSTRRSPPQESALSGAEAPQEDRAPDMGVDAERPPEGPPPARAPGPPGPAQSPEAAEPEEPIEPSVADPPSAEPATAKRRRRRLSTTWVAAGWAVSLIAVAIIAGAAALAAAPPAPTITGARHIATLQESPAFVWPRFFGEEPPDAHGYEDFFGMTPISASGMFTPSSTDACMVLVPSAQIAAESPSGQGQWFPGCSAGPFAATVQIVVRGDLPPELLSEFPEGTALQFVLDGSRVHVYSAGE